MKPVPDECPTYNIVVGWLDVFCRREPSQSVLEDEYSQWITACH